MTDRQLASEGREGKKRRRLEQKRCSAADLFLPSLRGQEHARETVRNTRGD